MVNATVAILGIVLVVLGIIVIRLILKRYVFSIPFATGEARRKAFPANDRKSHPIPQLGWHPKMILDIAPGGIVELDKVEKGLHFDQGFWTTSRKKIKIFWRSYRPAHIEDVSHGIVLIHGYGDHIDFTIRQTALTLAKLNKAWVFAMDLPGHGRSDGLWCLIEDWSYLVSQVAEFVKSIVRPRLKEIKKPIIGFGQSMGAALIITLTMNYPGLLDGATLVAPMCDVDGIRPGKFVTWALTAILKLGGGHLPLGPAVSFDGLQWKNPKLYESFYYSGLHINYLGYVDRPRLSTCQQNICAVEGIARRASKEMRTPFIILHGESDMICALRGSHRLYKNANVRDKTLKVLPGWYHGVLQENGEEHFEYIFQWINERFH